MIHIAIDGPAGAGKSTVAKALAKRLNIIYVDTGALYRTVGYHAFANQVSKEDKAGIVGLLKNIDIELKYDNGVQKVFLNGSDLGDKIRLPEISMYASAVSSIPEVRAFLLNTQRSIARDNSVVMDGRDIGTVILPDADVKIFLTASAEERARRRYDELIAKGKQVTLKEVCDDMNARDRQDLTRDVAPAIPAEDAIILDNTGFTLEESVDAVVEIIRSKKNGQEI